IFNHILSLLLISLPYLHFMIFFFLILLRPLRSTLFPYTTLFRSILDAGDRVLYVRARGNWYPMHGTQFADYDLRFRYPHDLELVSAGDVVEDRIEREWRVTRRRTSAPIRLAAFNLGNYAHAREERGAYVV